MRFCARAGSNCQPSLVEGAACSVQDLGAVGIWCVVFGERGMVHGRMQVAGAVGLGWGVGFESTVKIRV